MITASIVILINSITFLALIYSKIFTIVFCWPLKDATLHLYNLMPLYQAMETNVLCISQLVCFNISLTVRLPQTQMAFYSFTKRTTAMHSSSPFRDSVSNVSGQILWMWCSLLEYLPFGSLCSLYDNSWFNNVIMLCFWSKNHM